MIYQWATSVDLRNKHVDSAQSHQLGIFQSFARYHDWLKCIERELNRIAFQRLVQSNQIDWDCLRVRHL